MNEAKNYENLEVKFIPGADPKIIFFDADGNKLEEMKISQMDTPSMDQLLASKGIYKKANVTKREYVYPTRPASMKGGGR